MNKKIYTLKNQLLIAIIFISIFFTSCEKNPGGTPPPSDPCANLSVKFSTDVQTIINVSCASSFSCHGAGSNNSGGPLTDYNLIFAKRSSIKFQVENGLMPKGGALTADQKNKIICWINSGAPNN